MPHVKLIFVILTFIVQLFSNLFIILHLILAKRLKSGTTPLIAVLSRLNL